MIRLKSFEIWQWRNRFSDHPVAVADIESEAASSWNIGDLGPDALAVIRDRFAEVGAGVQSAGDLLAAICLSLQREKYDLAPSAGATPSQFWFAVADPVYASIAAGSAVAWLGGVSDRSQLTARELAQSLAEFVDRCEFAALDQTTRAMVAKAQARGIAWFRLNAGIPDVQLGHGFKQRRMRESIGDETLLASIYARNKPLSLSLLRGAGLPVGSFATAITADQAASVATSVGFPVVLKPVDADKGVGVIIGLADAEAVRLAARSLLQTCRQLLVQSFLPGDDHRLLVVSGRFLAAARRHAAAVVGDGEHSVEQLIEAENRDPRRAPGFKSLMNHIVVDDELVRILSGQGFALGSIPAAGRQVRLRLTANISTGGTSVDVTDVIHPDNAWLAERAAAITGLKVAGLDFMTPDITRSWREVGGGICEINVGVGLRAHWLANPTRDVVGPIMDTVFPPGEDGRIPTALITGSNGKTTVTRMLDHILRAAGHTVGSATTDGVTINGRIAVEGDYAGGSGAAIALGEPTVTAAALETARGGVLKWGIGVERCNVAALLNVEHEQVGIDGIETVDDMARLKRKVVETARDAFVFNAQDPRSHAMSRDFPAERTILFCLDPSAPQVADHLAVGGTVVTLAGDAGRQTIVIRGPDGEVSVLQAAAIPATLGGRVRHNVANALAAVALAHGMKTPVQAMAAGLGGFTASLEHSQGRFNFIDGLPARVLFDFACNPPAIRTALEALDQVAGPGRRIGLVSSPGNRPDDQIDDCARAVAHRFDHYVCYESVDWRRGRAPGEVSERLANALHAAGAPPDRVARAHTVADAMAAAASLAAPDDLVVILGAEIRTALPELRAAFARLRATRLAGNVPMATSAVPSPLGRRWPPKEVG
ncbi:MAG: glutamate ligase domain-containing protein [Caulobacterales bacterium]